MIDKFEHIGSVHIEQFTRDPAQAPHAHVIANHARRLGAQTEADHMPIGQCDLAQRDDRVEQLSGASGDQRQILDGLQVARFRCQFAVVDGDDVVVAVLEIGWRAERLVGILHHFWV